MSKIFDAVNRGTDSLAESLRPLIDIPEGHKSEAAIPEPAAVKSAEPAAPPVPGPAQPGDVSCRRMPLRIAAPSPLFPFDGDCWDASEQYRIVRAKLVQHPKQPRLIVISSAGPKDGKSVSAANVAGALSLKDEAKILLLEADMRRPALATRIGIPKTPGLADVLMGGCSLEDALVQTEELPNLYVMTAGTTPPNAAELLETANWHALCTRLRTIFRYTIMDSPPIAAVADFDLIQAGCDGVILVVRPDQTNRTLCKKGLKVVAKNKFLGVLLNCVPDGFFSRRNYYDNYYRRPSHAATSPTAKV